MNLLQISRGLAYFGRICLEVPAFGGVVSFLYQFRYDIHSLYEISLKTDSHEALVL